MNRTLFKTMDSFNFTCPIPMICTPKPVGRLTDLLTVSDKAENKFLSWHTWWVAPLSIIHDFEERTWPVDRNILEKHKVLEENVIPGKAVMVPPDVVHFSKIWYMFLHDNLTPSVWIRLIESSEELYDLSMLCLRVSNFITFTIVTSFNTICSIKLIPKRLEFGVVRRKIHRAQMKRLDLLCELIRSWQIRNAESCHQIFPDFRSIIESQYAPIDLLRNRIQ